MKISVVVRTFNRPDTLMESLTSISLQTYSNWELFILDDGDVKKTYEIFNQFNKKHPNNYVCYITANSEYDMFKKSWKIIPHIASGDILIRLDDDDILRETTFEKIKNIYETNDDIDFTLGSYATFNKSGISSIDIIKNIYEIAPTLHAWAPYTIPNNNPWKEPWMWYHNYYQTPMYYTSLIHCSKANVKMVYHLYTMRISSIKKIINDVDVSSTHVDDLEFFGQLDYKGLGYNMLKSVMIFVRDDNTDKITTHINKKGDVLYNEILKIRDKVDSCRPAGFVSRIVPIDDKLHYEDINLNNMNIEFNQYYNKLKNKSNIIFNN
jgi:glycosyltransferase involved in cell wall biosynthesis